MKEVGLALARRQGERGQRLGKVIRAQRQQRRLHRRHAGRLQATWEMDTGGASDAGAAARQAGQAHNQRARFLWGRTTASRRPLLTSRMALSAAWCLHLRG